jgi:hypothetical protein
MENNLLGTEWLVKKHFDVFGLIPKGLAYSYNDLDKLTLKTEKG